MSPAGFISLADTMGKKFSVYELVTNQIIEKLRKGTVPWRKPWNTHSAVNWKTQKPYRGVNILLLDPGEYATFKQIQEAGGKVKKGEKSHIVVFWKWIEKATGEIDSETGREKTEKFPCLRYYRVFEINTQCEGLESKRPKDQFFNNNPIEEAEKLISGFMDKPVIKFAPGRAYYRPSTDTVSVPGLRDYKEPAEYYSTLFHELVHSTGHEKRLGRPGVLKLAFFGSHEYSHEELVAEIGAAMLCGLSGIEQSTLDNSASYIQSWLRKLENDPKMVVFAASQAQKAADYITGQKPEVVT